MAEPFFEVRTVTMAYAPYRWSNGPGVARMPNGDLLAVWAATGAGPSLEVVVYSLSADHGCTWSHPALFAHDPEVMCGDASIIVAGEKVIVPYTTTELAPARPGDDTRRYKAMRGLQRSSLDSGRTWSEPQPFDKGRLYALSPNEGMILRDGTVVWPFYWVENAESGEEAFERDMHCVASVMRSMDSGNTWSVGGEVRVSGGIGADEPAVVELSNGDLYMLVRTSTGRLYQSWSSDKGTTWSEPTPSSLASPSAPAALYRLSWEPSKILVVWNNGAVRFPLAVAISYDDCRTWAHSRTISNPGCRVDYPGITTSADGHIIVVYQQWYNTNFNDHFDYTDIIGDIKCARFNEEWTKAGRFVSPRISM